MSNEQKILIFFFAYIVPFIIAFIGGFMCCKDMKEQKGKEGEK